MGKLVSILFLLGTSTAVAAIDIDTDQVEKGHELLNIRTQIKDVKSSIDKAKKDVEALFTQLRENEQGAAGIAERIATYRQQISQKRDELARLRNDKRAQEDQLGRQRQQLSRQIRAAYKTGRNNYVKLLLNQEDPELVGRMLAYYEYDTRERRQRISGIKVALAEIDSLEEQIRGETLQLTQMQSEQVTKLAELKSLRISREAITGKLQAYINDQTVQLQILQKDEQELAALVDKLDQREPTIQIYEDMPPFKSLRGKLDWPVRGLITSRFGTLRKGGKLKWQGVTIAAKNGVEVRAISTGKVVFADWFRNMGLLMILDHGDGYMSLYGHNERLLKKPGDWVLAGDLIAHVGDTGGQQVPGLYFEIRQGGNPINPTLWCKN